MLAVACAILAAMLFGAIASLFIPWGLPALTLPFVFATLAFVLLKGARDEAHPHGGGGHHHAGGAPGRPPGEHSEGVGRDAVGASRSGHRLVGRPYLIDLVKEPRMPKNLFPLDNTKKFTDQQHVGHNRWHPDIPPHVSVKPGDVFRADCREWFDGAIKNDDSADDVRNAPLPGVHVLSGPFRVEGAEPGDLLVVDILEIDAVRPGGRGAVVRHGLGLHGRVRQDERRRLPDRPLPRRLQGDLGLHAATSRRRGTSPSAPTSASTTRA